MVFTFNGVENVGLKEMDIKIKRGSIAIEDGELIYDNYNTPPRRVKLYGSLAWVGRDSNMTLAGSFTTRSLDMRAPNENSFKGQIRLQKSRRGIQTKLTSKLSEMNLLDTRPVVQPAANKKENETVSKTSPAPAKTQSKETASSTTKTDVIQSKEIEKQSQNVPGVSAAAAEIAKRET